MRGAPPRGSRSRRARVRHGRAQCGRSTVRRTVPAASHRRSGPRGVRPRTRRARRTRRTHHPGTYRGRRSLHGCTAFRRVAGDDVVATFTAAGDAHGWPAATLTDNGAVYTSRFTGGRNSFEYLLAYLGVRQKNGTPGHPQTQGKIERFQQTLKRWLERQPATRDLAAPGPARHLPCALQRAATPPGDRAPHAGSGLCDAAQGPSRRSRCARPLPSPVRRHRRQGRDHPPPRWPHAPPQGGHRSRPPALCWRSSISWRSRWSPSTPASSSRSTGSSPRKGTGATNDEPPADGRGPTRPADHNCRRCRDSRVTYVATQDIGRGERASASLTQQSLRFRLVKVTPRDVLPVTEARSA